MRGVVFVTYVLLSGLAMAEPVARPASLEVEMTGTTPGLQQWLAGFRGRALAQGISATVLDAALVDVVYLPDVIRRDRNQSEFTKTIWEYLDTAVSPDRISGGEKALGRNLALLNRIEAAYGVEKEIVVAVWGLESAYGAGRGDIGIIDSLASLAYDGRRGAFFESELIAVLQILQGDDTTPASLRGSWAGAMGHTQFMPSSYLKFAVDFTGDGKRDIWSDDPTDALASTAAYLAQSGWIKGAAWGVEITLPDDFDYALSGERITRSSAAWQALGVKSATGDALPDDGPASVLLPGGARGAAFLIFGNFHVIEKYNTADAYVIAIGHLADRLKGGGGLQAAWPRDLRALTLPERTEMQTRLTAAGFDAGGVDGKIGPLTIAAVKAFQRARGLIPDGYPSLDILDRLR